jgi:hypothetical protein
MLKDLNEPREPAKKRAERRWRNHDVATKYKAKKVEAKAASSKPEEPLLIETERPKADTVTRVENKFKKDIRAMLNQHKEMNVKVYAAIIRAQKRRLLLEKIRRLEASIAAREGGQNG